MNPRRRRHARARRQARKALERKRARRPIVRYYDARQIVLLVNGIPIASGYDDEEFLEIEP